MRKNIRPTAAALAALAVLATACGDSGTVTSAAAEAPADAPTVVVTTNILGDVVRNLVGDQMNVTTIMPVGADPHDFQASAQQVSFMESADALITNGANFEEGLFDVIWAAREEGVLTFEAIDAVSTIEFGEGGDVHDDEEEEDGHGHEEGEDEHGHEEGGADPHFFTDPARMALAAEEIAHFLIDNVEGIDAEVLQSNADEYVAELEALDAEVSDLFVDLPDDQKVLITNHEVFGYFADNYGFEVVGTVIPSGSTLDGTAAADLVELTEVIEHEGVPAIFGETSSSDELIQTLSLIHI